MILNTMKLIILQFFRLSELALYTLRLYALSSCGRFDKLRITLTVNRCNLVIIFQRHIKGVTFIPRIGYYIIKSSKARNCKCII